MCVIADIARRATAVDTETKPKLINSRMPEDNFKFLAIIYKRKIKRFAKIIKATYLVRTMTERQKKLKVFRGVVVNEREVFVDALTN